MHNLIQYILGKDPKTIENQLKSSSSQSSQEAAKEALEKFFAANRRYNHRKSRGE